MFVSRYSHVFPLSFRIISEDPQLNTVRAAVCVSLNITAHDVGARSAKFPRNYAVLVSQPRRRSSYYSHVVTVTVSLDLPHLMVLYLLRLFNHPFLRPPIFCILLTLFCF